MRLYSDGRYFDAHEALETVWRRSDDPAMRFLQGLIQWSVAFEHHRRGNAHGARVLLERAMRNIAAGPPGDLDMDISDCRATAPGLRRAFAAWEAGGARPEVRAPVIRGPDTASSRDVVSPPPD